MTGYFSNPTAGGAVAFADITGDPTDNAALDAALDAAGSGGSDFDSSTNNTGNTTITLAANIAALIYELTVTGSARTSVVILETTNAVEGAEIELAALLPATASIILDFRNATSGGTQLEILTTDGSGDDAMLRFRYNGSAWRHVLTTYPKGGA